MSETEINKIIQAQTPSSVTGESVKIDVEAIQNKKIADLTTAIAELTAKVDSLADHSHEKDLNVKKLATFESKIAQIENAETLRLKINEIIEALNPKAEAELTISPEVERSRIIAALSNPKIQADDAKRTALTKRLTELG